MNKREADRLAKLAAKNAAKEHKPREEKIKRYDSTLAKKPDDDLELRGFFTDMKKREF
ncbi:MAG: hypothetical protein ABI637_02965 [Gemmatimonadota bacterium]